MFSIEETVHFLAICRSDMKFQVVPLQIVILRLTQLSTNRCLWTNINWYDVTFFTFADYLNGIVFTD